MNWFTPNKNKNKVLNEKANAKKTLGVGDTVVVNYDPFGKHNTRHAVIESVRTGGYQVRFTSTKGESCDGGIRKPFERKDGTHVTTTSVTAFITYNQIL